MIILSIFMVPLVGLSLIGIVIVMGATSPVTPRYDNQSDQSINPADGSSLPGRLLPPV